ncbi:hypothetical protein Peur_044718 [Populus x canadensis]
MKFHVIFFIHYPAFLVIPSSFLLQTSLVYFLDIIDVFICRQDKPIFQGRVDGNLSSLHFLKYLNLMFVFKVLCSFWRSRINCSGTDFYSFESAKNLGRRSFRKEVRSKRVE